jgi:hypothetical protein
MQGEGYKIGKPLKTMEDTIKELFLKIGEVESVKKTYAHTRIKSNENISHR